MLTTYLGTFPYTKFILIEDSLTAKATDILAHLIKNHQKKQEYRTHFIVFEGCFKRVKNKNPEVECHDFTSDPRGWFGQKSLKNLISTLEDNSVVVVDSLVHVLYAYGLSDTYRVFHELRTRKNIQQVVTVLHGDLLEDVAKVTQCFQHLATLHFDLEPKRVSYTYKKSQRKIIKQIETWHIDNGRLVTEPIKKPDKEVIKETIEQINPENLSTFKIGLTDKDKESRSKLVLPYLPQESEGGKIHYVFDDVDDWDEEDPDDDLDI